MNLACSNRSRVGFFMVLAFALAPAALHTAGSASQEPKPKPAVVPQYNDRGELKRPTDYRTWVFVGTSIGLRYRQDVSDGTTRQGDGHKPAKLGDFHNVYINPPAYEHYVKTGKFPEKTMLVLDIYKAEAREPKGIVSGGLFSGEQLRIEVAVKNRARPDGSKTDWAYYDFPPGRPTARAFPDKTCYECHRAHAADDKVWVQFYPTLRPHMKHRDK
jgi:hypothetical protein